MFLVCTVYATFEVFPFSNSQVECLLILYLIKFWGGGGKEQVFNFMLLLRKALK